MACAPGGGRRLALSLALHSQRTELQDLLGGFGGLSTGSSERLGASRAHRIVHHVAGPGVPAQGSRASRLGLSCRAAQQRTDCCDHDGGGDDHGQHHEQP